MKTRLMLLGLHMILMGCGQQLVNGADGRPGSDCSVEQLSNGAIIRCASTTAILTPQGAQYAVVDIIDPCGDSPGFDEVLLRLANGQLLAHFASGSLQFLTLVPDGSYVTTDSQQCHFTVLNGQVIL